MAPVRASARQNARIKNDPIVIWLHSSAFRNLNKPTASVSQKRPCQDKSVLGYPVLRRHLRPPSALEKGRFRCDVLTEVLRSIGRNLARKKTALTGLALVVGCSTFAQPVPTDAVEAFVAACAPASGQLGSHATLATHAGRYRLTLVQRVDGVDVALARGTLVLHQQVPGLETLGTASTPLYGTADLDLGKVRAQHVGSVGSEFAEAPGVLVLEFDRNGVRHILLRFGSAANRRDRVIPDGAYTVMEVLEISGNGFSGSWRSGSNASSVGGRFCATSPFHLDGRQ